MSDVAKHAAVGHVTKAPFPVPPPPPVFPGIKEFVKEFAPKTAFDGDDYSPFTPSFDIDGGAARIVAEYDRDGDGAIDLGTGGELAEVLRRETSRRTDAGTSSIAKLAKYADEAGNRDGSATVEEIADVIRRFDQGSEGDGRLSGQERETFLEVFGEEKTAFRHRHPMPMPMPPAPPIWRGPELIGIRPYTKGS